MSSSSIARAWAITRADGLELGFTDHDGVLEFAGLRFRPDIGLSAQAVVQGAGLSVDNTEALGALSDGAITEADILAGRWDGAELRQWDVDWRDPARHRLVFRGHLGEVARAGGAFRAELRGLSEPLNQPLGRVFHPRCSAVLGDAACRADLTRPGLAAGARVISVDGGLLHVSTEGGIEDRWFERGTAEFLDGAARGLRCHVKNDRARPDGARTVELWTSPGIAPAPGDRLKLTAGCNKSPGECRVKFNNFMNFRGFPHLPEEDWLLAPGKERAGHGADSFQARIGGAS
ncbi:MAG: DUF2163 domain-containing protein [Paracoccus sp. (in: a-proteobacteria)]|nr:DUF2163 domain-containing protein [Paracoccus sp. (in: a-proteobacteria)]